MLTAKTTYSINRIIWMVPAFQMLVALALIVHRFATTIATAYDAYDATWSFVMQLIVSAVVLCFCWKRAKSQTLQLTMAFLGLGTTVVLGIFSCIEFMVIFNFRVMNCNDSIHSIDTGDSSNASLCARSAVNLVRCGVFWLVEVIAIHPFISYILDAWSLDTIWFSSTSNYTIS
ncbi:hypothetical protein BC830DRAFT_1128285 [Chytriomyces sp. MP71]|nr:hypothetical protein BC830DRAFT_1128285 [Chytriomyces sp. MP71]